MKVAENRVLRKISGSKREQVRVGGNCIKDLCGDQRRNEERGGEYVGKEKCMQDVGGQTWRKQTTSRPEEQMGG